MVAELGTLQGRAAPTCCATSSMELNIDIGHCPWNRCCRWAAPEPFNTMQQLGRAGHNPGRVSENAHLIRVPPQGGRILRHDRPGGQTGGVEQARPPGMCLDVLAQHLVSMAAGRIQRWRMCWKSTSRPTPSRT